MFSRVKGKGKTDQVVKLAGDQPNNWLECSSTSCVSLAAYRAKKITLWDVPAKSPDMNPIEMYWGWIRRKLRLMDLADLRLKRRPLGKSAYIIRVKNVMKTEKSQTVAKNFARRFRTACQQVLKRGGAAADN